MGLYNTKAYNARTRCSTDSFHVTSPGSPAPPEVCGTLTNEHSESERKERKEG